MVNNENKLVAYYIMQHKYLETLGLGDLSEDEILEKHSDIFPTDWFSLYELDDRINIISVALKKNVNLSVALETTFGINNDEIREITPDSYRTIFPKGNLEYFNSLDVASQRDYLQLNALYRRLLNEYIGNIGVNKYDDRLSKSELKFVPISDTAKDYYQYYAGTSHKYYYVRNNVYIERLANDDLEYLKERLMSGDSLTDEDFTFVERTFKCVIDEQFEVKNADYNVNFGPNSSTYYAPHNALVVGFRYDEFNLNGMTDSAWRDNNDKQYEMLETVEDELQSELSDKLEIPVQVIQYSDLSIKPIQDINITDKKEERTK